MIIGEYILANDIMTLPVVYFVLPCYNESEGLRHTADVLKKKINQLIACDGISGKVAFYLLTMDLKTVPGI